MEDFLEIILLIILLGGIFALIIYSAINSVKKRMLNKNAKLCENSDDESEPEYCEIRAAVIEQSCCTKMIGSKTPKAVEDYNVFFKTENDEIIEFNVPKEMYEGFEKGQTGILKYIGKDLYGFEIDC